MAQKAVVQYKTQSLGKRIIRDISHNKYKYLMILPVLVYLALFCYKPMYGIIIAFKNYKVARGIEKSPWVGLFWFENFFKDPYFFRLLRNTFTISGLTILFGFPAPILLALLLNEVHNNKFKRTVQTITYMPYFISLVVLCSLIKIYCQQNGLISDIVAFFGGTKQNWLQDPKYFRLIYVLSDIWQGIGWNSIIYLAALSGIDQEQYEAARVDGANKLQQIIHITIPALSEIIAIMLILQIGKMFDDNFDQIFNLYSPSVYEVSDVFETYVYRNGIQQSKFSYSAAVGLVKSVLALAMIVFSNKASKKLGAQGLF